jgi:molybdenum cofactor cytidylyltransferase
VSPSLVILAAGASTRLGQCKALAPINGITVLDRILAADTGQQRPLVVAGPDYEVIAAAAPASVEVIAHPNWGAGRTGSVARAVLERKGCDLMLAPVDCPAVPRSVFVALRDAWDAAGAPARGWLAPRLGKRGFGHPIVVGRVLLQDLARFDPDRPLRDLRTLAEPVWATPVVEVAVLEDLDTPQDLARIEARVQSEQS